MESKNHFYGLDANILGRPKEYVDTSATLPSAVQSTLEENFLLMDSSGSGNMGLCRPGKTLPDYSGLTDTQDWEYSVQHASKDSEGRTDFISQIAMTLPIYQTIYTGYLSCDYYKLQEHSI